MRTLKKVKIVATLGPSSSSYDMIKTLFMEGVDVFRLNMSHGAHEQQKANYDIIRQIESELEQPIGVLADLQGPKIRCGEFEHDSYRLQNGDQFRLDLNPEKGNATRVQLPHPEIMESLEEGATILINDGKIRLKVKKKHADSVDCIVEIGGEISDRKGINLPDILVPLAALTPKDRKDLEFACQIGVDWIALSFVQRPQDVQMARELINGRAAVIAKIEKPSAVESFDNILTVADGVMVARGDLGVEMPVSKVPPIQKRLIKACRQRGKPVIVATQMLESMIETPMPTRAEVSDVASAIYDGADAVMLSAESAAGKYPVESVKTMFQVAKSVEQDPEYRSYMDSYQSQAKPDIATAIAAAAREVADTVHVKAICCFTHSGTTAILNSRERPNVPIIALTPFEKTARKLCLYWGLHCSISAPVDRFKKAVALAAKKVHQLHIAKKTDKIVVTAGIPFNEAGTTNILRVAYADEDKILNASQNDA